MPLLRITNHELRIMVFVLSMILSSLFMIHPAYATSPTPCDPTIPGDCPAGLQQLEDVFANIISIVVGLGFVAMLVLLTWAGFKYLTSGGDPKALQTARQTATWAILGVFFMVIAWIILQLIENFTGIKVTVVDLKTLCGDGGIEFCK